MTDPYWESADRPDRERLLDGVARFWPFASVLEIGCNSGPVRKRLRERFGQDWDYVGVDYDGPALSQARWHASGQNAAPQDTRAVFRMLDIRTGLADLADGSVDVAVSTSVLSCLQKADMEAALAHLRRIASLGVVVVEAYGRGQEVSGEGWAHKYPAWVVTC